VQPRSPGSQPLRWAVPDPYFFQAGDDMYNRYIPQPDGSHRRSPVNSGVSQRRQQAQEKSEAAPCPESTHSEEPKHMPPPSFKAGDFLRRLIPKDLDTGDLLIIVLLLLMSADCQEEKNSALLTLALYLFM